MSEAIREWAATLNCLLANGHVQEVRIAGPDLLALSVRQPGATDLVGLSVLAAAPGVMLLKSQASQPRADGLLTSLRDLLRARAVGARIERVRACVGEHPMLRVDLVSKEGWASLVLDLSGRGNLEVHGEGHAPQALRPPAGDLPEALEENGAPAAINSGDARARLAEETLRLESLRARILHERTLSELRQRLRRACKGAASLVERREGDVARLGDPTGIRVEADALAAHLHLVRRGQALLEIDDWNGSPLQITLDPAIPASSTMQRLYGRAAKAERGVLEAGRRLEEARVRAVTLEALRERALDAMLDWPSSIHGSAAAASQALAQLEADATVLLRPERAQPGTSSAGPGQRARESALKPREFVSKDGLRILVGRSAKGNHQLTFRLARGNDVWMHARGCPGAHVVLMLPKGSEIPSESLVDAATLAHAHSKLSKEPRGEVAWCRAKDVHTRRGLKVGEVTTTREKVLPLRVEPERLARLEASEVGAAQ